VCKKYSTPQQKGNYFLALSDGFARLHIVTTDERFYLKRIEDLFSVKNREDETRTQNKMCCFDDIEKAIFVLQKSVLLSSSYNSETNNFNFTLSIPLRCPASHDPISSENSTIQ
jgi:hypothetical protein